MNTAPRARGDLERFRDDYDNARAALDWAWSTNQDELAFEIGITCSRYWLGTGSFHDANAWLQTALPRIAALPERAELHALEVAGLLAFFVLADTGQADELWAQGAVIANQLDLVEEAAWLDQLRAGVAWNRGDIQAAIATNERLLAFHQERGNRSAIAGSLHLLGEQWRDLGDYERAETQLRAADSIYRELGNDVGLANNSHSLADLALDRGNYAEAIEIYRTTMTEYAGEDSRIHAYCLAGIASVLAATGHDSEAAALWGAVCNAEQSLGFTMLSSERRRYETHLSRLEGSESWVLGRNVDLEQATQSLSSISAVIAGEA